MGAPVLAWTDVRSHNADEAWQLDDWLDEACRDGQVPALVLGDLTLVRPLGWAAIPVVAVSTAADDVTFLSRYVGGRCVVPGYLPPHDGRTTDVLCALGKKLAALCGRRVPLVYGSDDQLELIYRQRARFVQDLHLVLNPPALAWALVDKAGFARLCAARDVATPATVVPDEPAAAAREIERLRPPVLVKPRRKSDWKRIQQALFEPSAKAGVFAHARELIAHEAFSRLADVIIVQEYVEAPVANLLSFHGFATDDGEVLGSFVGRKVHTFPAIAGESALLEIAADPQVEAVGREVIGKLGVVGPFKIDFLRDPHAGTLLALEINARYTLWHHLGAAHGVNLPQIAHAYQAHGGRPEGARRSDPVPAMRWMNFYRELHAFRQTRPVSVARWLASLFAQPNLHEIFSWRDPVPFAAHLGRGLRRRWQRWRGLDAAPPGSGQTASKNVRSPWRSMG